MENRPSLSRWHTDHQDVFQRFIAADSLSSRLMHDAELIARRILEIRQVQSRGANAGRILTRRAAARDTRGVPGRGLLGRNRAKAHRAAVGAGRGLAINRFADGK